MKAIVVGCGEMGETAIQDLYKYGSFDEICIASRSPEKAEAVKNELRGEPTKINSVRIEASNSSALSVLMEDYDVAVNCAGPNYKYEAAVARAAIKAGVDLVDINDDYEATYEMFKLDKEAKKAGITIILGLGASPGVNNVLVRAAANRLDEVEEIHTAWVMSGSDPGGLALSYHLLRSLSGKAQTLQNGKWIEVDSFKDGRERIEFPEPVGPLDVYHIGHPEPITLAKTFPNARYVDDKATFIPNKVNDWIVSLGEMVRTAPGPIQVNGNSIDAMDFAASYFHQKCKSMINVEKKGALRVTVKGKKRGKDRTVNFSSAGRISMGTGIPASIGAIMLVQGKIDQKGVVPPEACIEPNDFLYEILDRRNVAKLNGWIED
jgi:saccharopine dehydrogenase (NAD+, L-lysine-forming)